MLRAALFTWACLLHLVWSFFVALPPLSFCAILTVASVLLKTIRKLFEYILGSPLSILFIPFTSSLQPYYAWARLRLLEGMQAQAKTLAEWRGLDGLIRASAGEDPSDTSAITRHLIAQLQHAISTRNSKAILYNLQSAATHCISVKTPIDHAALIHEMTIGLAFVTHNYAELGIPLPIVRDFFADLRLFVGRTALCLSGGGSLAMGHLGLLKVLLAEGLLPRVISGTSGGSIVAAIACLARDAELAAILADPGELVGSARLCDRLVGCSKPTGPLAPEVEGRAPVFFEDFSAQLLHFFTLAAAGAPSPSLVRHDVFRDTLRNQFGDETFLSAYQRTGRILIISVFSQFQEQRNGGEPTGNGQPLILSYVSSPQVLIYSAVHASCALPGLMSAAQLLALSESGAHTPYHPLSSSAIDGSLFADIPVSELSLVFSTRRFIVSQTNPHVALFLAPPRSAAREKSPMAGLDRAISLLDMTITQRFAELARAGAVPHTLGKILVPLTSQLYSAGSLSDSLTGVTIIPRGPSFTLLRAFVQPSKADVGEMARCGERAAWPELRFIEALTSLERCISACFAVLGSSDAADSLSHPLLPLAPASLGEGGALHPAPAPAMAEAAVLRHRRPQPLSPLSLPPPSPQQQQQQEWPAPLVHPPGPAAGGSAQPSSSA
jgi:predicted acylesterase/phospholipase RssA